jgi:hypothetical protein
MVIVHIYTPKYDVIGVCLSISKGKRKRGKKIAIDDDYEIERRPTTLISIILFYY